MLDFEQDVCVLIVEDDDTFRIRLAKALRKRGARTCEAAGVDEARQVIARERPTFAVVDLRLQDGSGLEVVEALKIAEPEARALILTGYGNIPTAVAAVQLGALDYMAKPAGADEITDALLVRKGERPPPPEQPIPPEIARQEHIEKVFHEAGDNVSQTARLLNMHRRTLQRILKKIDRPDEARQSGRR